MGENPEGQLKPNTRNRLLGRLDTLVKAGRVTSQEAARLRSAANPGESDATITDIRVRHTANELDSAVDGGRMTRQEADAFLERLRQGEHSSALRSHLRGVLHSARPRGRVPDADPAPPPRQEDPSP